MVQQHTVVPPLYFGHLSYTPPPGFSGHFPGVNNVPPGYSYRDNLKTARKDALWANATNPQYSRALAHFFDRITSLMAVVGSRCAVLALRSK